MANEIKTFSQKEYSRILDLYHARTNGLSQTECEDILVQEGASYQQAKNGAYIYLHHGEHQILTHRMKQNEYDEILDKFEAINKTSMECIKHLESAGFNYGQSKNAVYKYRKARGLIRKST
ncbi:MAG TPA: hypothetical protein DHV36_20370 [Desulfobacteraceae bacterium]|nr:hypothetical protein [Desulfobacteraceae bacterium]